VNLGIHKNSVDESTTRVAILDNQTSVSY